MTLSKFQLQEYVGLFGYLLETDQQDKAMDLIEQLGEGDSLCHQVAAPICYPPCPDPPCPDLPCLPIPSGDAQP